MTDVAVVVNEHPVTPSAKNDKAKEAVRRMGFIEPLRSAELTR
jgi:hypothetical protein